MWCTDCGHNVLPIVYNEGVVQSQPLTSGGAPHALGRYQIAFELASGGMATIYLARVVGVAGFEKLVALKCMHPHLARQPEYVEMFFDEARIASRIGHPNVCSVFDFGEVDGTYYIAMDYVHGVTVAHIMRRVVKNREEISTPKWIGMVAKIVAAAAEGLHAAHEVRDDEGQPLHVIHRDVTPQNLFVAFDGTVRVVDFGVASAAHRLHQTQTGAVKGKLAYLAPEQAKRGPIDRRVDVWALGVVLWEMLVGERLFQRDSAPETIAAVLFDKIPNPSSIRPHIPGELDRIVMRALARELDARYPTAQALAQDLHRFGTRASEPITSHDIGAWVSAAFAKEKADRETQIAEARRGWSAPVGRGDRNSASRIAPTEARASESSSSGIAAKAAAPRVSEGGLEEATFVTPPPRELTLPPRERTPAGATRAADMPAEAPTPGASEAALASGFAPAEAEPGSASVVLPAPRTRNLPLVPLAIAVGTAMVAMSIALVVPALGGGGEAATARESPVVAPPASAGPPGGAGVGTGAGTEPEPERGSAAPQQGAGADNSAPVASGAGGERAGGTGSSDIGSSDMASAAGAAMVATGAGESGTARSVERPGGDESPRSARRQVGSRGSSKITPTSAPSSAARGTGSVSLATPGGWADVFLDGRPIGRAPGTLTLPAGRRVLELRPFGRTPGRRITVTVPTDDTVRVVEPLL
jgi:serine/threonine-protein kinase